MLWTLRTKAGQFWIKGDGRGRFTLGVDDDALGSYYHPNAAADDVHLHATGHYAWDRISDYSAPEDLSGWQRVR